MRSIKAATATAALLSLTLLPTGCASAEDTAEAGSAQRATESATPSAAATSSPTPSSAASSSPVTTAEKECLGESRAGLVVHSWELVEASKGASDHARMAEGFYETVESAFDANEMSNGPCRGNLELSELQFEAAALKAIVGIRGEADESRYTDLVETGNAWFEAIESDNVMGET